MMKGSTTDATASASPQASAVANIYVAILSGHESVEYPPSSTPL